MYGHSQHWLVFMAMYIVVWSQPALAGISVVPVLSTGTKIIPVSAFLIPVPARTISILIPVSVLELELEQ